MDEEIWGIRRTRVSGPFDVNALLLTVGTSGILLAGRNTAEKKSATPASPQAG